MQNENTMKKKVKILILVIFIIAIVSMSCFLIYEKVFDNKSSELIDTNENQVETSKEEKPIEVEEKNPVKIINVNSKTRPYAVMINCHSAALPQSGLQDAYVVYEIMVEYGITRMMALFKDVPMNKVGSIRSARNQYLGYVFENDAIFVHAGGSKEALNRIF